MLSNYSSGAAGETTAATSCYYGKVTVRNENDYTLLAKYNQHTEFYKPP